jgi:hypothetical protein
MQAQASSPGVWSQLPAEFEIIHDTLRPGDLNLRLKGMTTDGCHKKAESDTWIINNTIFIDNLIQFKPTGFCAKALFPYIEDIEVRNLKSGNFAVVIRNLNDQYVKVGTFSLL